MDFKEEIKKVLKLLKVYGYSRRAIERELKYSDQAIDQALSRGGNEAMLDALTAFLEEVKLKSVTNEQEIAQTATIQMLFNEVAKLKSRVTGQKFDEVVDEMDQSIVLLIKDILKKKGGSS